MALIYIAVNTLNNNVYVGQTTKRLMQRKSEHYSKAKRKEDNTYFHNALNAYPDNVFEWLVLEEIPDNDANNAEIFWIAYYKSIGVSLYNKSYGGESGMRGYKHSEETRRQHSIAMKGKSAHNKGKVSPLIGIPKTDAHKANMRLAKSKQWNIALQSPDGVIYSNIVNLKDFCIVHNLRYPNIHAVALGNRKQHKGWTLA